MSATSQSETPQRTKRESPFTPLDKTAMVLSALIEQAGAAGFQVTITPEPARIIVAIDGATVKDGEICHA